MHVILDVLRKVDKRTIIISLAERINQSMVNLSCKRQLCGKLGEQRAELMGRPSGDIFIVGIRAPSHLSSHPRTADHLRGSASASWAVLYGIVPSADIVGSWKERRKALMGKYRHPSPRLPCNRDFPGIADLKIKVGETHLPRWVNS